MENQRSVNGPRRRLVSAQLTARKDPDLLEWAHVLAREGRLSDAVRDGLRLLRVLEQTPGAPELFRRGLIAEALQQGPMRPAPKPDDPVTYLERREVRIRQPPDVPLSSDDVEANLDALLGSV